MRRKAGPSRDTAWPPLPTSWVPDPHQGREQGKSPTCCAEKLPRGAHLPTAQHSSLPHGCLIRVTVWPVLLDRAAFPAQGPGGREGPKSPHAQGSELSAWAP